MERFAKLSEVDQTDFAIAIRVEFRSETRVLDVLAEDPSKVAEVEQVRGSRTVDVTEASE